MRKHCRGGKILARTQNIFLENFKNIFSFEDADFVSSTYVAWGRKRLSLWETSEGTLTDCFLVCVLKQRISKT